ncbi:MULTISPECIES: IclR family transcriptional regulator [unclassified Frigoribacterium]|uniref:IclR family transcriptional regulator n=1 Tax=unclassified Frigoribacterium TaxID=2627005 RepID=UPI000F478C44|nr:MULTISPECIES: IclR family transcriptional regulator [unclassified Frigoribacterium]ROP77427.1 IclR family transcriptional regulator [Frigoribacterium sp. PhB107]TDT65279.1 IclR family transcriptional regulator [Frigoribacterium sp. PhB116]
MVTEASGVRAVSRALDVLQAFTPERTSLSIGELVKAAGLPRTTVLRLVETLVAERMLQHVADGRVAVGTRLIRWGAFASAAWTVPEATAARMAELAAETGETVSLYVRSGTTRVVVAQSPSPHSLRHVVQVGDELPLWKGAAGMVLLSSVAPEALGAEVAALAATVAGAGAGSGTGSGAGAPSASGAGSNVGSAAEVVDEEALVARVEQARAAGWSLSHGVREPGNSGMAVLVRSRDGAQPVALALGGPTSRFTDEATARFLGALQAASSDIARTGLPPALD